MRSRWTKGLVLALGLIAGVSRAQQPLEPAPIVAIGRPVTIGRPVANTSSAPAAYISRPVPLSPRASEPVEQASFVGGRQPVVRGVAPDPVPRPEAGGLHGWAAPVDPADAPLPGVAPITYQGTAGPPPVWPGQLMYGGPDGGMPPAIAATPGAPVARLPVGPDGCACEGCSGGCGSGDCGLLPGAAFQDGGWGHNRWWLSAEYLLWWTKGDNTPPLVTAAPFAAGPTAGIVPNAQVLFGGSGLGEEARSGMRLSGGFWFSDQHVWGLEASAFFLAEKQDRFNAASGGDPVIRRPIINQFGQNDGEIVAALASQAGPVTGNVGVLHRSALWGYEVNAVRRWYCGESFTLDGLLGFRAVSLDESLAIQENLALLNPPAAFGGVNGIVVNDKFSTSNRFYGGQVGLRGELWLWDRLSVGMTTKVALGTTWQRVQVDGSTTALTNGVPIATGVGGLLALPTNIGVRTHNAFSVIPEVGLALNYQVTDWMRLSAGYNFLYWSNVVRPGNQIDPNVNRTFQPFSPVPPTGPAVPAPLYNTGDFWAHGLTLGLEFRY